MKSMLVAIRFFALALLALGGTACPPTRVEPNPTEQALPLTVNELCQIYLSAYASDGLCTQQPATTGLDFDEAKIARDCRAGTSARAWVDELYEALRVGKVKMDWKLARECLDKSREMRKAGPAYLLIANAEWTALQDGACKSFVSGGTADGAPCKRDWECGEGNGCYTLDPYDPNGAHCMAPAAAGEACPNWVGAYSAYVGPYMYFRPCETGAWCDASSQCKAMGAVGDSCVGGDSGNYGADCLSGNCTNANHCAEAPVLKALGDECTIDTDGYDDCEGSGECINCRPDSAGGVNACRVLGGVGAYCRDLDDCVSDLGCKDNACAAEVAGSPCSAGAGTTSQLVCANGLTCVSNVAACEQYTTAQQCNSQVPDCGWDSGWEICDFGLGTCYAAADIPTSGPCLNGHACGTGTYCRLSDTTCQPPATENQPCSTTTGPPCATGLVCFEDVCRKSCDYNQDCQAGYSCGTNYMCQPLTPTACGDSTMCPADFYCVVPPDPCYLQHADVCSKLELCTAGADSYCVPVANCMALSPDTCTDNPDCFVDASYGCQSTCYRITAQATCTANPACSWDANNGYCDSKCFYQATDTECMAVAGCVYEPLCELKAPIGMCLRKVAVGEPCTDSDYEPSEQCLSGICMADTNRCALELSGCNGDRTNATIRATFLFGLVFLGARGLRRWRKS